MTVTDIPKSDTLPGVEADTIRAVVEKWSLSSSEEHAVVWSPYAGWATACVEPHPWCPALTADETELILLRDGWGVPDRAYATTAFPDREPQALWLLSNGNQLHRRQPLHDLVDYLTGIDPQAVMDDLLRRLAGMRSAAAILRIP